MPNEEELVQERIRKLEALHEKGVEPYPYRFERKDVASDLHERFAHLKAEEHTEVNAVIAGRIVGFRRMGKAAFFHVQDQTGKMQVYAREDELGVDVYAVLKLLDMGDIVGVSGILFKTKTGELTLNAKIITLLTKSLHPLPEKWHGLSDVEQRYRQRYVDLIINPEVKAVMQKRSQIIQSVRDTLTTHGFLEVETPILQPQYGGANARPFITMLNALKMQVYMRISNELYLKRLLVGGFERIFEFAKDFRNEDIDRTHNPEFTQVEFYQAYADLFDVMKLTEEIFENACVLINGKTVVQFGEHVLDFKAPFVRMTMKDALRKYGKIDADELSEKDLLDLVKKYKLELKGPPTKGEAIQVLFEEFCEKHLVQPTFIVNHPPETTPLCKRSRADPEMVERFELFIAGMELSNAYSELNDPIMQRKLLEAQANELRAGSEEAHPMDEDFLRAIEYGMPPTGGVGIGIDRVVMLLTGQVSIRDVIFFPFMKQ